MIWLAAASVHTEGVNWELVAAVVTCVVTTMTVVFGLFARLVSGQITSAIDRFRIEVVSVMDKRLTIVETILGVRKKSESQPDPSTRGRFRHG
jgi:hypothetical protein